MNEMNIIFGDYNSNLTFDLQEFAEDLIDNDIKNFTTCSDYKITVKKIIAELKKNSVVRETIPTGFGAGLPIVQIENKRVCLLIPYFKFTRVNQVDKSMIYPIKYYVTVLWSNREILKFENLQYNNIFSNVDFNEPVGFFRHDAIKQYNAGQYNEKRNELYEMYDKFIYFLVNDEPFSNEDEKKFKELLNIIIEPSLVRFYEILDKKFSDKFLIKGIK